VVKKSVKDIPSVCEIITEFEEGVSRQRNLALYHGPSHTRTAFQVTHPKKPRSNMGTIVSAEGHVVL
jgi:hypothetical protein